MSDESNKQAHKEQVKAQMVKEALDTVEVINLLDEDIIIHNDRQRPTHTKWIIPGKNKDLGKGKGVQHVPAFIGWRYIEIALTRIISDISQKDWDKKKDEYKDAERSAYEERLAIRTNNRSLRSELIPKLWGGIVKRYGGDDILEEEPETKNPSTRMDIKSYLEEVGLSNKLVSEASVENDAFIKEIS